MKYETVESRKYIIREIISRIENKVTKYFHIFGGYKIGKTYVLKILRSQLEEKELNNVVFYRFPRDFNLPINEWLNEIIDNIINRSKNEKLIEFRNSSINKNPQTVFWQIVKKLKNSNYVKSPENLILLLDDLHRINDNDEYYKDYYNYLERLYEDESMNNFFIVTTTHRNYIERPHGGSSFFLNCHPITLKPFRMEDLKQIFSGCSDSVISQIERKTGGIPEILNRVIHALENKSCSEISEEELTLIWELISEEVRVEHFTRRLNTDEQLLLTEIIKKMDTDDFVEIISLGESNKYLQQKITALKDFGIIEEEGSRLSINGEILKEKIRKNFLPLAEIYSVLKDGQKVQKEFNLRGEKKGNKVKEWLLDKENKNLVTLIYRLNEFRSIDLAREIVSLASSYSGIVSFGLSRFGLMDLNLSLSQIQAFTMNAIEYIDDNTLLEYQWGYFIIEGRKIHCLLIRKSPEGLAIEGSYYIKRDGFYCQIDNSIDLNPDNYIPKEEGYLFLPSLCRYQSRRENHAYEPIPFPRDFLKDDIDKKLFLEWIEKNGGENKMIELKKEFPTSKEGKERLGKQVVTLSNTSSGIVVFGIEELADGSLKIKGVEHVQETERKIYTLEKSTKGVISVLERLSINNKTILLYFISKGKDLASYKGKAYTRMGDNIKYLPVAEIAEYERRIFKQGPHGFIVTSEFIEWKRRCSNS